MAGAVLERVLVDETIEVVCQGTRDFGRSTGARAIHQPLGALVGKTIDPFPHGGVRKLERVGDGLEAVPFDDCAYGLGTPEHPGLLGLFQQCVSSGQGIIGKVESQGPHGGGLQEKLRQKFIVDMAPLVWCTV
jgi:hypothetical protein